MRRRLQSPAAQARHTAEDTSFFSVGWLGSIWVGALSQRLALGSLMKMENEYKHNQQKPAGEASTSRKKSTDTKKIGFKARFLPREWIMDVIVNEHVTSHRVMSIVLFRVYPQNILCSSSNKEFNIKDATLVAAFNPNMVDMTYRECMQMWEGIRDGLELTAYQSIQESTGTTW